MTFSEVLKKTNEDKDTKNIPAKQALEHLSLKAPPVNWKPIVVGD